ncbi:MAG: phosphatidate cytidylyltransferase [Bacteroidetes bacterium]|jgi:phosphatidate cytidylyltransferase|nr:phosphatidate cytidylyltransferase [Bacteroidota bacterium]
MKELFKRTVYGILFVVLIIGSILISKYLFALLLLVVVLIGTQEMINLRLKSGMQLIDKTLVLVNSLLFFMLIGGIALDLTPQKLLSLALLTLLFPFIHALFSKTYSFTELASIHWPSIFLVSLPAGLLVTFFNQKLVGEIAGSQLIISILALVWINDIFAYLVGITIGKHRLFERISPKKSWEGSIGGLVFTVAATVLYSHLTGFLSLQAAIIMATIIVVFGSLGDLIESMIKRQAGVKDSGKIIPGHGGILDRFDASFYAVPFIFVYLSLFN